MAKILVTRKLPDDVERRLADTHDATLQEEGAVLETEDLPALSEGYDALLVNPADPVPAEIVEQLPQSIKMIATFSVGYEHVNIDACKARGIAVTNTPGVLTDATADIALLLMLAASRRAFEGEAMLRTGQWTGWTPTQLMGIQIGGRRLGILGMGRIGQAVAARARAFGMEIHYHNRMKKPPEEEQGAIYHDTAEGLLAVSDVLSLHCPLTAETRHFLNADRIEMLPRDAIVINTARGPVIDDEALIAALKSGRVAAAGLDVFDGEPNLNDAYKSVINATLLPHLGSATIDTRNAMGFRALDNLDAFFAGDDPPDRIV